MPERRDKDRSPDRKKPRPVSSTKPTAGKPAPSGKPASPGGRTARARPRHQAGKGRPERADVYKKVRLVEPLGSPEYYAQMSALYGVLQELRSRQLVRSDPHEVMAVLDAFQQANVVPARVYESHFFVLPEGDRSIVDRLIREQGIVEATVAFRDTRYNVEDIEVERDYTNRELIDRIFRPRTPLAVELIDPAVYASTVPGETLADLFSTISSIKSALVGTLWLASDRNPFSEEVKSQREQAMQRYAERPRQAREWDARTLGSLISRYASHEDRTVRELATRLTAGYVALFNEHADLSSLVFLREQLEVVAAQPGFYEQLRSLLTTLKEVIAIVKKGPESAKTLKKAEKPLLRFRGWKTHQK